MKKIFYLFFSATLFGLSLSSCIENDGENSYTAQDFYTVKGSYASGYTLYGDAGSYCTIDKSAFNSAEGFGDIERVLMTVVYTEDMITADQSGLTNPNISECIVIPTDNPISVDAAASQKITENDSLFTVSSFDVKAVNGYLTAYVYASYGTIRPTLNLVYDPAATEQRTDSIDLQLCYNPHTSSHSYSGSYYSCFRLDPFVSIPGSNDVVMKVSCKGCSDVTIKVKRSAFRFSPTK